MRYDESRYLAAGAGADPPTTARLRRSANPPLAGGIFHTISGGRNAFDGFGHLGGDLAGRGAVPTFSRLTRTPESV
jgi:hypothetical protein